MKCIISADSVFKSYINMCLKQIRDNISLLHIMHRQWTEINKYITNEAVSKSIIHLNDAQQQTDMFRPLALISVTVTYLRVLMTSFVISWWVSHETFSRWACQLLWEKKTNYIYSTSKQVHLWGGYNAREQ